MQAWYLTPATIEAIRAGHEVTCERDGQDYHWSVVRTPAFEVVERAWRDAFYAAQRDMAAGKAWADCMAGYGLNVSASLIAAEASGVTPYDWAHCHQMPAVRAALRSIDLAEQVAA